MLSKEKIDRINILAKKSKAEGLNDEECAEQQILRDEYLKNFREHFKSRLENIKFIEDIEDVVDSVVDDVEEIVEDMVGDFETIVENVKNKKS